MLLSMKQMLSIAQENKFAVGAFNAGNVELFNCILEACIINRSPAIISIHPDELDYMGKGTVEYLVAQSVASPIPLVMHLDHGVTVEHIIQALSCGFSSVMIDGSALSFNDNINISKKAVDLALSFKKYKDFTPSVEAELGTIGNIDSAEGGSEEIIYTNPEDARLFVQETKVDTLAVAIGTSHGIYPKDKIPTLRLDILEEIQKGVSIPLVLHGGSGNKDNEIKEAISKGICKINISSDYKASFFNKCREILSSDLSLKEPNQIFPPCSKEAVKIISEKMKLFQSINKTSLFS